MPSVREVLRDKGTDVETVAHDASVFDAVVKMSRRRIGALVVMQGEKIAGMFSERDVMNRVMAAGKNPATTRVFEVMTSRIACCSPDSTLDECRTAMTHHRIRHLPVVQDGRLVGILSSGDLLAREMRVQEETIRFLHEYVTGPN